MAWGDLSGADSWRLKAEIRHEQLDFQESRSSEQAAFTVVNHHMSADGSDVLCEETCRFAFAARPAGILLLWHSSFRPTGGEIYFGDQEEMGLGIRVATPLSVRDGMGTFTNSQGGVNEEEVWGKQSNWCDYAGPTDGRHAGMMLMAHPSNFRRSWMHARDYGFVAANPFGRKAFTGGEPSRIVVPPGETLELRFAVLLHSHPTADDFDPAAAYEDMLEIAERIQQTSLSRGGEGG